MKRMIKSIPKNKQVIISISYGNYLKSNGGTDKVILEHQTFFNQNGVSYIFLYPFKRKYFGIDILAYSVILDGIEIAEYLPKEKIYNYLKLLHEQNFSFQGFFIHHLMGNSVESLRWLLGAIQIPVYIYLHDYYTCCPQYNLLRNDEYFCDPLSNSQCHYCQYDEMAQHNRLEFRRLLDDVKECLIVIAPSQKCAQIWIHFYPEYASNIHVIPHQKMIKLDRNDRKINQRLRLAFIGRQVYCKGWLDWKKIVELINTNNLPYDLYYFGTGSEQLKNVKNSVVMFKVGNTNAMIDALTENHIDVVALLSNWPETYSYTLYEAVSANCYVLTNSDSGNIEHEVISNMWGTVYNSDKELVELVLDYDKMRQFVLDYRKNNTNYFDIVPNSEELLEIVKNQVIPPKFNLPVQKNVDLALMCVRVLKKIIKYIKG